MRRYIALIIDQDLVNFGALRDWCHKLLLIVMLGQQLLLEVLRIGQYLATHSNLICIRAHRIL